MADLPPNAERGDDGDDVRSELDSTTGTPRWVKSFWLVLVVLVLLFVVLHLAGGGFRGHTGP